MFESVAWSIGRNWRRDYNRNSIAGTAVFLRLNVHSDYSDLIIGSASDEIHASLHQISDRDN